MVTKIKTSTSTFIADKARETFILDAGRSVTVVDAAGIDAVDTAEGRTIVIHGAVSSFGNFSSDASVGIDLTGPAQGDLETIRIGETGSVRGNIAIRASVNRVRVENDGEIFGALQGISIDGLFARIENSGDIIGGVARGLAAASGKTRIVNSGSILTEDTFGQDLAALLVTNTFIVENSGRIDGIQLAAASTTHGRVVNTGTIIGSEDAIISEASAKGFDGPFGYEIVNRGTIEGDIDLAASASADLVDTRNGAVDGAIKTGSGDDRIDLRGASVSGVIEGGGGNDVYLISELEFTIAEGVDAGIDAVLTSVSLSFEAGANFENITLVGKGDIDATGNDANNILIGNAGDNVLTGGAGDDTLRGNGGNDRMFGNDGSDTFVFKDGSGRDRIEDFQFEGPDQDVIDLSDIASVRNFADLFENHLRADGDDVVIDLGKGDRIRLENASIELLAESHFLV